MFRYRSLTIAVAVLSLATACGSESPSTESAVESGVLDTLPAVPTEVVGADDSVPTPPLVAAPTALPLPELQTVQLDQPALWPASDTVFDTPEEAAESFVSTVLGVDPVLGEFASGDSRSGEIQVFSPGDMPSEDADLSSGGCSVCASSAQTMGGSSSRRTVKGCRSVRPKHLIVCLRAR